MMEVQKQWVNVDGKWQHKEITQQPTTPSRPAKIPPSLPSRPATKTAPPLPQRSEAPVTNVIPTRKIPALPQRRPSEAPSHNARLSIDLPLSRRTSNESMNSTATTETAISTYSNGTSITSRSDRYTVRAPEYDSSTLPKLPPKRTQEEKDAAARAARYPKSRKSSTTSTRTVESIPSLERSKTQGPPSTAVLGNLPAGPTDVDGPKVTARVEPPSLPDRAGARQLPLLPKRQPVEDVPALPKRTTPSQRQIIPPPPATVRKSALEMGFGHPQRSDPDNTPRLPTRPVDSLPTRPGNNLTIRPIENVQPPPIPLASRPDLSALQASKPKTNGAPAAASASDCLLCRDFSAPDKHAARFPRQSLPSQDIGWLAQQLTAPFASLTDKARAIFAWLHENIAYDVDSFFSGNMQHCTPQGTILSGLAVCEGYAQLFAAIALKAGLEAVVIHGGSKGYGYAPPTPGAAIPPYKSDHAWNACKIDGGVWKLIDSCWGAGNVKGPGIPFEKMMATEHFIMSNCDFGLSHYPEHSEQQYREDGRVVSWEEYYLCNKNITAAFVYGGYTIAEGISDKSIKPVENPLVLSQQGPKVRFSFQSICPHWDPIRHGKGPHYMYVLRADSIAEAKKPDPIFQHRDGIWWCDVSTKDLGKPGQKAIICAINKVNGRDARGITMAEYERKTAWSYGYLASWTMA